MTELLTAEPVGARHLAQPRLPSVDPCTIVIFGAAGDLARRKLVPSLYNLASQGCTGHEFRVLGVGRTEISDDEFRSQMREAVAHAKDTRDFDPERWRHFADRLSYMVGDPNNDGMHEELAARLAALAEVDGVRGSRNRVFYLSTPPSVAGFIVNGLAGAGLNREEHGWSRIVIEKPFGRDLQSARELNELVGQHFREEQIYRIDHFLGKDTVQNILVFRFGNSMFEPFWNRNFVDYVEITAAETLGVGTRGGFYEETGALRDMVANHLLQLLCLTAMEPPVRWDANSIREKKVDVLQSIRPMRADEVPILTVRGQYTAGEIAGEPVPGYTQEAGVAEGSSVETYAALEFHIDNWRWSGVPFYVRTGKRLARTVTEIAVHLRRTPQALFAHTHDEDGPGGADPTPHDVEPNVIVLRMQPQEAITISFGAKRPGVEMEVGTASLSFSYQSAFGVQSPAAYETLLLDVMRGDITLFTRRDEVEAQWRLITPIEDAWAEERPPRVHEYVAGSSGPPAADELLRRNGHAWRHLAEGPIALGERESAV